MYPSVLTYLLVPKVEPTAAVTNETREKESSSKLSALSNFSLGDMFDGIREGPKSVKFPEKLLKVLEQKLQDIAMGRDAGCVIAYVLKHLVLTIPFKLL